MVELEGAGAKCRVSDKDLSLQIGLSKLLKGDPDPYVYIFNYSDFIICCGFFICLPGSQRIGHHLPVLTASEGIIVLY